MLSAMFINYSERLREGTTEYKLGRLDRRPSRHITQDWTDQQRADYARGQRDRERAKRRRRRRGLLRNLWEVPAVIVGALGVIVGMAFVAALPLLIVLLAVKILFL